MITVRCSRAWEAEAVSDGRLGTGERSSFERHALGCAVCRREIAELVALDATMRELPALESTPFERQRLRGRLLQRVDQELLGTAPRRMQARSLALALASLVFAVGIALGWVFGVGSPGSRDEAPVAALLPQFELESANRASWDDRSVGSVARIVLRSGTVAVKVRHLHAPQRFLLVLPDGELEVHGTRFIVRIDGGRTARVDVTEGVVSLRLEGHVERTLLAGDHWERSAAPTVPEPAGSAHSVPMPTPPLPLPLPIPTPALSGALAPAGEPHAASSSSSASKRALSRGARGDTAGGALAAQAAAMPAEPKAGPVEPKAGPVEPKAGPVEPDAREVPPASVPESGGFAAGVAAFRRGEYGAAERLLAEFARNAAGDARREDAAFLRAVARSRLGDARGAAELAASYLKSFPTGLRRAEAERLVRAADAR